MKKKSYIKRICILLTLVVLGTSFPMPPVQAQQWSGKNAAMERSWQTDRCQITARLSGSWEGGYTAEITVRNTSNAPIENWHVSFSNPWNDSQIKQIWNARVLKNTQGETVFKNEGWNQDIAVGESVVFGFTAAENFVGFPELCELPVSKRTVPEGDYKVTCEVRDVWDTGYSGNLHILNSTERTIEDWQLSFEMSCDIDDLWNGRIVSRESDRFLVKNNTYNQNIAPGETLTIGFTVNDGSAEDLPHDFRLEELTWTGGYNTSGEDDSNTESGSNEGDGSDKGSGEDGPDSESGPSMEAGTGDGADEKVRLTIDTDSFDVNEMWDIYLTQQRVENLSGTLKGIEKVEKLSYVITDMNDLAIGGGEIEVRDVWRVEGIGLVLGINYITVTAVCKQGDVVEARLDLMNFNQENMNAADVDLSDTDGDGLNNYYETLYGTDPLQADTDGDGLKDLEELTQTGTDPLLTDSDDNGIWDGQEDLDGDGLCNLEELAAGTGIWYSDTDGDGLSDGEEVLQYHTDPLQADTDEDGLQDGEDIRLGFDPLDPDTDDNGILDGNEICRQTYTKELDQERKEGITQVSVSLDCAGCIDGQITVQNVYQLDMRSSDVVGLIGAPVAIETEAEFDTATITFTYDEQALGETNEDNLRIMWYDEENDRYNILDEETVLDKEHHTLSCSTTHFSTWMVVDRMVWWAAMRGDLWYEDISGRVGPYCDFAYVINWEQCTNEDLSIYRGDGYIYYTMHYDDDQNGVRRVEIEYEEMTPLEAINWCISWLNNNKRSDVSKQAYIFDLNDVEYDQRTVQRAIEGGIEINCITAPYQNKNSNMMRMASETGGRYYEVKTWELDYFRTVVRDDIIEINWERIFKNRDSDGDGLYDAYEEKGFRLSNGTIVYTDPHKYDTDDDGINDLLYVGSLPIEEKYTVDGVTFSCMVCRGGVYPKLSEDFLYVDGRMNENGVVNDERMEYVSYSNDFYYEKYEKTVNVMMFEDERDTKGEAGVHGLFADKLASSNEYVTAAKYASFNTLLLVIISQLTPDPNATHCLYTYFNGTGGSYQGCKGQGSRDYIAANYMLFRGDLFGLNSAKTCFKQNMQEAMRAAESALNEYNTEAYLGLSPNRKWTGCSYVDYSDFNLKDPFQILTNTSAFGIFNSAEASITMHCTYDPATKKYKMEYSYYIVDFYDFSLFPLLHEEDALGLARSYELFGKCTGILTWEKGKIGWGIRTGM